MGEVPFLFKATICWAQAFYIGHSASLSRHHYCPHFTDEEGKAQMSQHWWGCQNLSSSVHSELSSVLCYSRLNPPLTFNPTQPISTYLPFLPSQDVLTSPGLFLSLLSFLLQPSLLTIIPELLWYSRRYGTQSHLALHPGSAVLPWTHWLTSLESLEKWAASSWGFWMISWKSLYGSSL